MKYEWTIPLKWKEGDVMRGNDLRQREDGSLFFDTPPPTPKPSHAQQIRVVRILRASEHYQVAEVELLEPFDPSPVRTAYPKGFAREAR